MPLDGELVFLPAAVSGGVGAVVAEEARFAGDGPLAGGAGLVGEPIFELLAVGVELGGASVAEEADGDDGDGGRVFNDDAALSGAGWAHVGGAVEEGHGGFGLRFAGGLAGHDDGSGHGNVAGRDMLEEREEQAVGCSFVGDDGVAVGLVVFQFNCTGWCRVGIAFRQRRRNPSLPRTENAQWFPCSILCVDDFQFVWRIACDTKDGPVAGGEDVKGFGRLGGGCRNG